VHALAEKGIMPLDKSLRMISDRARMPYMPLGRYELDIELTRTFNRAVCLRWCILPFDRMSKTVFVGTANPFNKLAIADLERVAKARLVWYLMPPGDLLKTLGKAFR
jgi:hypothetical protein